MSWCFDIVVDLPNDLSAACLSFLDVRSLLIGVQRVNHSWRDAIDGRLPAVWHDVRLGELQCASVVDAQLAIVAQKSRGEILSLKALYIIVITMNGLQHLRACTNLRVLDVSFSRGDCSINPALPALSLLERLTIESSDGVVFPPLPFLKTVFCASCKLVKHIRNLPALTKLKLHGCVVDADDTWPASLGKVDVQGDSEFQPFIIDRIAALPHLIRLDTDWSFVCKDQHAFFTPPYDQLSFLRRITSLQHLRLQSLPTQVINACLDATMALRELELVDVLARDQDLQGVAQLTNVQSISFSAIRTFTSHGLRHFSALPNLTRLSFSNALCNISDLSPLGLCSQLRELTVIQAPSSQRQPVVGEHALTQLQHLEKLNLYIALGNPSASALSHICGIRSLRDLAVWVGDVDIPASAFASLPSLTLLEVISVRPTKAMTELVDCLVQMPKIRCVYLCHKLNDEDEARLRAALPRLEHIWWG